jgi:hypothetical protein
MSDCYGSKDVENEMKQDGGGFTQGSFHNAADTDTTEPSVPDAEADAISQKVNTANSINENIGSAPAGGSVRLTQTDEKAIGRMASEYIREVNNYREQEKKRMLDNFRNLTGRIAKTMNLYTRFSSGLARRFTDRLAPVYMFLARTLPVQGRSIMEHPLVSSIQDGFRTVSGLRSSYSEKLDNIRKLTRKYLKDSTISTNKALELIGDRLNLSQMPVHTDIILRNWQQRMNEILAIAEKDKFDINKPDANIAHINLSKEYAQLFANHEWLTANRNIQGPFLYDSKHPTAGLLDSDAAARDAKIKELLIRHGLSEKQQQEIMSSMAGVIRASMTDLSKAGQVVPEQLQYFADYDDFVPFASNQDNVSRSVTDTDNYLPGKFHQAQGMKQPPVSAWYTIQHFANRAAARVGMSKAAMAMYSAEQAMKYNLSTRNKLAVYNDYIQQGIDPFSENAPKSARDRFRNYTIEDINNARELQRNIKKGGKGVDKYAMTHNPFYSISYEHLMRKQFSPSEAERNMYYAITSSSTHGGGLNFIAPRLDSTGKYVRDKAGNIIYDRRFIQFDVRYSDEKSHITGAELNDAMTSVLRLDERLNFLAKATAMMGHSCTSLNIGFAPCNGARDFMERGVNMANRDYVDSYGQHVPGYKMLASYVSQLPKAFNAVIHQVIGRLDPNSEYGKYFKEFTDAGLHYTYSRAIGKESTSLINNIDNLNKFYADKKNAQTEKTIDRIASRFGEMREIVSKWIYAWNDVWNLTPSLAQYVAMRKRGIEPSQTANAVSEVMDQSQTGQYTNALRMFFPFTNPTLQGARAMLRTVGLAPGADGGFHMSYRGMATFVGLTAVGNMLYSFARESLGQDEDTGAYRIDSLPISDLCRYIPIPTNDKGDYFKMPIGFGIAQLASSMAIAMDRMERGIASAEDVMPEFMAAIAKQMSPADAPSYNFSMSPATWLMQVLSPALLRPIEDVAVNRNYKGRPITYYSASEGAYTSAADSGWATTAPVYKNLAKEILQTTGIDFAPEQLKALLRGYATGFLRFIPSYIDAEKNPANNPEKGMYNKLGPVAFGLGGTMYRGEITDVGRSLYDRYKAEIMSRVRQEGVVLKTGDRKIIAKPEKYRAWRVSQLRNAGWDDPDIIKVLTILDTDSEIKKAQQGTKEKIARLIDLDDDEGLKELFRVRYENQNNAYNRAVAVLSQE